MIKRIFFFFLHFSDHLSFRASVFDVKGKKLLSNRPDGTENELASLGFHLRPCEVPWKSSRTVELEDNEECLIMCRERKGFVVQESK